jgi:hypothetical protein
MTVRRLGSGDAPAGSKLVSKIHMWCDLEALEAKEASR